MTPEQEEQVRRALVAAARAEDEHPPLPADVADRLDTVLDELLAPRTTAAAPSGDDELARRRRRRWSNGPRWRGGRHRRVRSGERVRDRLPDGRRHRLGRQRRPTVGLRVGFRLELGLAGRVQPGGTRPHLAGRRRRAVRRAA
jgi:hypothetical protein